MASRLASRLLRSATAAAAATTNGAAVHIHRQFTTTATTSISQSQQTLISLLNLRSSQTLTLRSFSSLSRPARSHPSARSDIGARARQLQTRRLWTYALTFSCIAGFVVIVLSQFQDQLVFYLTPTDALSKYAENPSKAKFRLGGLVLEGSVTHDSSSAEMEFVVTDLITDILVRYDGMLPDLFREGHSVVVEGFVKPFTEEMKKKDEEILSSDKLSVTEKARTGDCYFAASVVLAKHDEKYMPSEVAAALEKNKKFLSEEQKQQEEEGADAAAETETETATARA